MFCSVLKESIEFCNEVKIPFLMLRTQTLSSGRGHKSSMMPSWKENRRGCSSRAFLNSVDWVSATSFLGLIGSDADNSTSSSYRRIEHGDIHKKDDVHSWPHGAMTIQFNCVDWGKLW